ncbi:Haloacid dehalogenase-like hydrolase-domain-containing protein [Biscogniauxia marginata]|nr:Haloacid dehalogenase-like hydrolase-domain-containing protein [Biscogniauxia marginata]
MQALPSRATSGCTTAALGSASRILRPHFLTTLPPGRTSGAALSSRDYHQGLLLPRASRRCGYGRFVGLGTRTLITDERAKGDAVALGKPPPFAFALDIDGVLLHVAKPIPGAAETLAYLQENKIPFILLTNGGGKHEEERVADLSAHLGVELSTENFVQSHTPFQELASSSPSYVFTSGNNEKLLEGLEGLRDKNILVTGSDPAKARIIAESYGFQHVITPADILAAHPTIYPFEPLYDVAATARPLPTPNPKISAIFVFNDPRDWAVDAQIITDLLLSDGGVLGTYSARNGSRDVQHNGWQKDGQPRLLFSNPDLFWSAEYHLPRFGQGAFQAALYGIWERVTGGRDRKTGRKARLRRINIGKPFPGTYAYAERMLAALRAKMLGSDVDAGVDNAEKEGKEEVKEEGKNGETTTTPTPTPKNGLKTVYMIGDNPASDIRGANDWSSPAGTRWVSALVKTGVWNPERGDPRYRPRVVVDDVKEAVEWALREEGWGGEGWEGIK